MTKKECEKELRKKIKEIWETVKEFSGDTKYIAMYCIEENGEISLGINNEYFNKGFPKRQKIDFYYKERIENDEKYTD